MKFILRGVLQLFSFFCCQMTIMAQSGLFNILTLTERWGSDLTTMLCHSGMRKFKNSFKIHKFSKKHNSQFIKTLKDQRTREKKSYRCATLEILLADYFHLFLFKLLFGLFISNNLNDFLFFRFCFLTCTSTGLDRQENIFSLSLVQFQKLLQVIQTLICFWFVMDIMYFSTISTCMYEYDIEWKDWILWLFDWDFFSEMGFFWWNTWKIN